MTRWLWIAITTLVRSTLCKEGIANLVRSRTFLPSKNPDVEGFEILNRTREMTVCLGMELVNQLSTQCALSVACWVPCCMLLIKNDSGMVYVRVVISPGRSYKPSVNQNIDWCLLSDKGKSKDLTKTANGPTTTICDFAHDRCIITCRSVMWARTAGMWMHFVRIVTVMCCDASRKLNSQCRAKKLLRWQLFKIISNRVHYALYTTTKRFLFGADQGMAEIR